jgi:hypothetical protein
LARVKGRGDHHVTSGAQAEAGGHLFLQFENVN